MPHRTKSCQGKCNHFENGSQMSNEKTATRAWKATLVFGEFADLRAFLQQHGVRISDFAITDKDGNHLGFDDVVLSMPQSVDETQTTLYSGTEA